MANGRTTQDNTDLQAENLRLRHRIRELEASVSGVSYADRLKLNILERAPFSLWACDRNFIIKLWSEGASKTYGIGSEDAIGKTYLDLFVSPEERYQSASDCLAIIDNDRVQRNFLAYDRAYGGIGKALLTNCFRIWDEQEQDYLQAEVALEVPELEPIIEAHRNVREIAITELAEYERILLLERLGRFTALISASIFGNDGPWQALRDIDTVVRDIVSEEAFSSIFLVDEPSRSISGSVPKEYDILFRRIYEMYGVDVLTSGSEIFVGSIDSSSQLLLSQSEVGSALSSSSWGIIPLSSSDHLLGVWIIFNPNQAAFSRINQGNCPRYCATSFLCS